jgi:hypothetical protein
MINLNGTLFKLVIEVLSPIIDNTTFVRIKMTINEAKSSALKKILKVGEDVLVTHTGDSENPRLKSSTAVGAGNSNQEFVIKISATVICRQRMYDSI